MFETLFGFLNTIIINNIAAMVGNFTTVIMPLIGGFVGLYIIYLAWEALNNNQNFIVMETIKTIGSLGAVTMVALNTPWYMAHIVPFVLYTPDDITAALLGEGENASNSLQMLWDNVWVSLKLIASNIEFGISDAALLSMFLNGTMLFLSVIGFVPFFFISVATLLGAKIAVSFLLIVGPMFIMMAFFPSTRAFFQAWTGQCFNYMLLSVFFALSFMFAIEIIDEVVLSKNITVENIILSVIIFFSLCVLATQLPTLSSTLSGGVGISGLVGNTMSGLKNSAGAARAAHGAGIATRAYGKSVATNIANVGKGNVKSG
ncbi:conjugal transfer protein TrbL [Vibrio sinensis]|uniref:Conjugal transfer protein TrbL n=1 Tax=Vibrio sinensis TaxID=2302434 RepID=A0A3A6Q669_9VIBR|nr:type IV secretion system protein [Vibrio sinensis]RJX65843.1 conjugal transfer protein TrbL [Vibrio sinensis]